MPRGCWNCYTNGINENAPLPSLATAGGIFSPQNGCNTVGVDAHVDPRNIAKNLMQGGRERIYALQSEMGRDKSLPYGSTEDGSVY